MSGHATTYRTRIGSQEVELPLVELSDELTIALLITVDQGVDFVEVAGAELAELLAGSGVEVVVTAATMGIPVAIAVTSALGLDDYLVLHKTPKINLRDALTEPVKSITTGPEQHLRLDRARLGAVENKRVAFVDDVISTGGSASAALRLLRRAGAEVCAIGALATETVLWRTAFGEDVGLVRALAAIPVFRPDGAGGLREDWEG